MVVEGVRPRPDRDQFELVRLAPSLLRDLPIDPGDAELDRCKLIEPAFSYGKMLRRCLDLEDNYKVASDCGRPVLWSAWSMDPVLVWGSGYWSDALARDQVAWRDEVREVSNF
jgi:hypothetical protein